MKKSLIILATLIIAANLMGNNALNIRGGFLNTKSSKTSFYPGVSYGVNVDNVVEVAFGFDYFHRNFNEKRTVNIDTTAAGTEYVTKELGTDISTYYIPAMATLKVSFPVGMVFIPYAGAGLGWGLLWEDVFIPAGIEDDIEYEAIDELSFYNGFNWILMLGAKYKLSPNVHLYGESFFNFGKMKKDVKKDQYGTTWDEIDMSGIGLRLGVELRMR